MIVVPAERTDTGQDCGVLDALSPHRILQREQEVVARVERRLPRKALHEIVHAADPRRLLDGTQYGGWSIPAELLEAARRHRAGLPPAAQAAFRFLHVSTDEVYGSLGPSDPAFTEETPYAPNSPYAASKAAAFPSSEPTVRQHPETATESTSARSRSKHTRSSASS